MEASLFILWIAFISTIAYIVDKRFEIKQPLSHKPLKDYDDYYNDIALAATCFKNRKEFDIVLNSISKFQYTFIGSRNRFEVEQDVNELIGIAEKRYTKITIENYKPTTGIWL